MIRFNMVGYPSNNLVLEAVVRAFESLSGASELELWCVTDAEKSAVLSLVTKYKVSLNTDGAPFLRIYHKGEV